MFRGHVRDSPAFSTDEQESVLRDFGVTERAIYRDQLKAAIESLRKGDHLVVVGFRGLADSRSEILAAIEAVHKRGAAVMDAKTKGLSTNKRQCENLVAQAVADLANERRGPRKEVRGRMPWDQIAKLWFDKTMKTKDVMEKVNEGRRGRQKVSFATVYRRLKKRDALPGRPSKK
jgi:hypothetical protein